MHDQIDVTVFFDEPDQYYRKNRKQKNKKQQRHHSNTGLIIKDIQPKTKNQQRVFESYLKNNHLLLHGLAGTGKTFLSLFLALKEVLDGRTKKRKVVIVRSVVPTRDMGFLPGNQNEKQKVYESPYYAICTELFGRGDAYDNLKRRGAVEFISTSFIRGTTINNAIVIVDECQNMNFHEIDSVITRLGDNCKIIFCGDFRQSDLKNDKERKGILDFMRVIKNVDGFSSIQFNEDDIVRSELVKQYIIAKMDEGIYT